ncbi:MULTISPECIES: hypothetical protein [Streptomyces]|uniref:C2H2-type domain-containing protein n=1 Tax=Streptomyces lonegramiae TaxID=3075524 RepID=A0ABU2XIW4_9ACTN|nr:hypothetical protein [Streptomyces sp. DSM 41529]MDT0545871.1 hypothetical protein [Streptomyces sp. DSM 41529]
MSEIAGTSSGVRPIAHTTTDATDGEVAHEAYAFACMKCGHGWEQSYDIEHHVDAEGRAFVVYFTDGLRVRSPLTSPNCHNCGADLVRIMRSGQVSTALRSLTGQPRRRGRRAAGADGEASDGASAAQAPREERQRRGHHWHLSDLLHPFQNHRK